MGTGGARHGARGACASPRERRRPDSGGGGCWVLLWTNKKVQTTPAGLATVAVWLAGIGFVLVLAGVFVVLAESDRAKAAATLNSAETSSAPAFGKSSLPSGQPSRVSRELVPSSAATLPYWQCRE